MRTSFLVLGLAVFAGARSPAPRAVAKDGPTHGISGRTRLRPPKRQTPAAVPHGREGYITTAGGVRLFYQIIGDGPQTVIIPGRLFLTHTLRRLAPGRRLIFYDTRSRGRSDAVHDSTRESIDDDERDLEAVRQYFAADKVSTIGYSYMGLLVMLHAKDHPDHVERVIQLDPVPRRFGTTYPPGLSQDYAAALDPAASRQLDSLQKQGFDRSHPRAYCEREWRVTRFALVGDPAHVDRLAAGPDGLCDLPNEWPVNLEPHFAASFASIQHVNLTADDIAHITMPVLTIHGTKDRNAPYGGGREWAMTLPDARLLTVRGAAHQAFDEYPDIVVPAIDRFLSGRWPSDVEKVTALVPATP